MERVKETNTKSGKEGRVHELKSMRGRGGTQGWREKRREKP